jgi:hypothetical protein
MHTLILKKCVEELKKENPKIDYILGMLETIIELSNEPIKNSIIPHQERGREDRLETPNSQRGGAETLREEEGNPIPDFLKPGPLGKIT